jgi:hypothetical protein
MRPETQRLSKTRFTAGWQCHKQLWWRVHEPDALELAPDEALSALFAQGRRVGERARAHVPGGEWINLPYDALTERVAATAAAIERRAPAIYEASFWTDDVFASVDILERLPHGHCLIEVKAAASVKDEHLPDAALQTWAARRSGLDVRRVEIMHLNRACAYPDLSDLFIRADVTEAVEALLPQIAEAVESQKRMLAGPLPEVPIGAHCEQPRACPFMARCWPPLPPHHLGTLYRVQARKLAEWEAQGYATIHDLPRSVTLGAVAERQRRAVQSGTLIVERGLARALAPIRAPIAFLDFETLALPIPAWNGCHPFDQVPVQFSVHLEDHAGRRAHHEWMADGPGDPRPELAARLIAACQGAQTVIAYHANFERGCLEHLARAAPKHAEALRALAAALFDLLPVVRDHVYHPDFGGRFSLKDVVPALLPELAYADLEIASGEAASRALERLMFEGDLLGDDERAELRSHLLRYCERDTWVMVKLLEHLRQLAPGG